MCLYWLRTKKMNKFLTPRWIKRYLELAECIALWSKDPRKKVGSIIVNSNGCIVSQGYNGFPRGIEDNERYQDKAVKNVLVVHAEVNAILNALYNGVSVQGCSIFISGLPPCHECAKVILQSGIQSVVFDTYPDRKSSWWKSNLDAIMMLEESKVLTLYFNGTDIYRVFIYDGQLYSSLYI